MLVLLHVIVRNIKVELLPPILYILKILVLYILMFSTMNIFRATNIYANFFIFNCLFANAFSK